MTSSKDFIYFRLLDSSMQCLWFFTDSCGCGITEIHSHSSFRSSGHQLYWLEEQEIPQYFNRAEFEATE